MCWSFLPHVRFLILLTVFELLPKTCNFTICSIFSNSSHVGWCTASPDTILKLDTLVMIQTKFGFHWSSTFRGEDFWKSLRRTTDDDDGRQVMRIAHMTLWVRWANNILSNNVHQFYNPTRVKPWHRILSVSSVFCVVLWGLSEDSYQVTFRLFSCFEFWCLRFCQKSATT